MKQLKLKDLGLKKINTIAVSVTSIMCAIFIVSFFTINGFIASVANAALPACNTATKGTLTKHDGAVVYCDGISWNGVGAEGTGGDFWEDAGSGKIYYSEGLVGVNTTDPKTALDVDGTLVSNDSITAKKITFGAGGITLQDVADSECAGASDAGRVRYNSILKRIEVCNTISFEPVDGDIIPPFLLTTNPVDDATNAIISQDIILTFNEVVNADSGFITIFNAIDDSVFETFTIGSPRIQNLGTDIIYIDPTANFDAGQEYYVLISSSLFVDDNDNYFVGIDDKETLSFITADPSPPSHLSFFPADDSSGATRNTNIIITFTEPIKAGSGTVEIRRTSDNALIESIPVSSNQITGYNSSVITINPSANLPSFTNVYVSVPAGAFQDIAGNSYAGVINPLDWNFVTEDSGPPLLTNTTPNDGASAVSKTANIVLTFNEIVNAGAGDIVIHNYDDDTVFETINASATTGLGTTTITINPAGTLDSSRRYYILIGNTAFADANGNNYAGITNKNVFDFMTLDDVAPTLLSSSPLDNATDVEGSDNITLSFDEAVQAQTGNIQIRRTADDSVFEAISVTSARVTGSGTANIMILPTADFESETEYYVQIDASGFDDLSGNSYVGITATTDLSFTTLDGDAPSTTLFDPAPASLDVSLTTNLEITFDEIVNAGAGNITIHRMIDDVIVESIAASSATGLGTTTITLDPSSDLEDTKTYYILIADNAFEDVSGNSYAGLTDKNTWYFTTPAGASIWETATPNLQSQIYPFFKETNSDAGQAVCISGQWAVMGQRGADEYGTNAGSASVYKFNGNNWDFHQELIPSYRNTGDLFATMVECDNDFVFVNARDGSESGTAVGDLYVFKLQNDIWTQTQVLSNGNDDDDFGRSMHRYGDLLAVSANKNDTTAIDTGIFYTYRLSAGTWILEDTINADISYTSTARMGVAITLDNDYLITSAIFDDETAIDSGAIAVYKRNQTTGTWGHIQKIKAPSPTLGDFFGFLLSYDNGTIAAATKNADLSGSVHIYEVNASGTFDHTQTINASDSQAGDYFGYNSVSLKDNTLIIGAYQDDTGGTDRGELYIYTKQNGTWVETHKYQPDDLTDGNFFGQGLDYDGEKIIVGAVKDNDKGTDVGSAYIITPDDQTNPHLLSSTPAHQSHEHIINADIILTFNENVTTQTGNIYLYGYDDDTLIETFAAGSALVTGTSTNEITINPTDDLIASTQYYILVEDTVFDDMNGRSYAGVSDKNQFTFTTDYPESNWTGANPAFKETKGYGPDAVANDSFGQDSVLIDNYVFVSTSNQNSNMGAVYAFEYTDNLGWVFLQKLIASDASTGDFFGYSIDAEENVLVVGAEREDTNNGAVYIFRKNSLGQWIETQKLEASDESGDYFGSSVSIDNNIIAVGSRGEDTTNNNSGAIYVFNRVGSAWTETQKIKTNDPDADDNIGNGTVDINGNHIIASAQSDDEFGSDAGALYVFYLENNTWTQQAKIVATETMAGDGFGKNAALYGNTIIVGNDLAAGGGTLRGESYIFTKTGDEWIQTQTLTASNSADNYGFGSCVDIYENSIVIGSFLEDTTAADSGASYIFTKTASTWSEQSTQKMWDTVQVSARYGNNCSIHKNLSFIAASAEDVGGQNNRGAGYMISPTDPSPPHLVSSNPSDGASSVSFNTNITLTFNDIVTTNTGNIEIYEYDTDTLFETIDVTSGRVTGLGTTELVIDPIGEMDIGKEYYLLIDQDAFVNTAGLGYLGLSQKTQLNFEVNSNLSPWTNTTPYLDQKFVSPHDDSNSNGFGYSVAVDNNLAISSAYREDFSGFNDAGAVYFYKQNNNGAWDMAQRVENPDPANSDVFGLFVSIEKNTAVIAAFLDDAADTNAGAVYVYNYNGTSWNLSQKLTASTPENGALFGSSVDIYGDTIAVGAREENSSRGAVYIFENQSGVWSETQKITEIDVTAGSSYGTRLSLDGTFLVVGVRNNHKWVYVYEYNGTNWVLNNRIENSDPLASNDFGSEVSISNDTIVIIDNAYNTNAGAVYVYEYNGTNWIETDRYDNRKGKVEVDGNTIINSSAAYDITGPDHGAMYVYTKDSLTGDWSEQSISTPFDNIDNLNFGSSIAVDGTTIIVGAGTWSSSDKFRDQIWFYSAEPRITTSTPERGSSNFGITQDLVLNFNKDVGVSGNGRLQIIQESNGAVAETVDLNGVNVSGNETNQITIDLSNDLIAGEDYYITLTDGAFLDETAGASLGLSGANGFYFTTFKTSPWAGTQAVEIEKILSPTSVTSDQTGRQISIDGSYALSSSLAADNYGTNSGQAYIYIKNGDNWIIQQELVPSSIGAGSVYGRYSQISGDFAFVGSEQDSGQGAVFVFKRSGGTWTEHQKLQASDGASGDVFGSTLHAKDNQLVIIAEGDDDADTDSGAIYIFEFDGSNWIETSKIVLMNPSSGYIIGNRVYVDGDIIVSAHTNGNTDTGIGFIFEKNNGIWQQTKTLTPPDLVAGDRLGQSPIIKGNQIFMGTHRQDTFTGAVYVFEKVNNDWIQKQKITASDASINSAFGISSSLYKNTLMIAAHQQDDGLSDAGKMYIFTQDIDGLWNEKSTFQSSVLYTGALYGASTAIYEDYIIVSAWGDSENGPSTGALYSYYNKPLNSNIVENKIQSSPTVASAEFSESVSVYGDYAVAGAPKENSNSGAAYVFKKTGESWTQTKEIRPNDISTGDKFGHAIDIWGDYVAISASDQNGSEGSVYLFKRAQETWSQITKITPPNVTNGERFGASLEINDGFLVVGAPNGSGKTGIAYLYEMDFGGSDNWGLRKTLTASDAASTDFFGASVSVHNNRVAIGASYEGTIGAAYIYERNSGGVDNWGEIKKLSPSDGSTNDSFATGVSIYNETVLVGSPNADAGSTNQGAVYFFSKDEGGVDNWGETQKIIASDADNNAFFGYSVSLQGITAIAGASGSASGAFNQAGQAYEISLINGTWTQTRVLSAQDKAFGDALGFSIDSHQGTYIASAGGEDTGGANAGAAYIFYSASPVIISSSPIDDSVDNANRTDISIIFDRAITRDSGSVYIRKIADDSIVETYDINAAEISIDGAILNIDRSLKTPLPSVTDFYLTLDNTTIRNGQNYFNGISDKATFNFSTGSVWLNAAAPNKVHTGYNPDGSADSYFGSAGDVDGDWIAVAASHLNGPNNTLAEYRYGAVFLYNRNYGGVNNWGLVKTIRSPDPGNQDYFGYGNSISIEGNWMAIGEGYGDSLTTNAGSVHLYNKDQGGVDNWGFVKTIHGSSSSAYDYFGIGARMNDEMLFVIAPYNDDIGLDVGAGYIFAKDQGGVDNWGEVAKIYPDGLSLPVDWWTDLTGTNMYIDSNIAVLGSHRWDDNGFLDTGRVYIYDKDQGGTNNWGLVKTINNPTPNFTSELFGIGIASDGDWLFVGAPHDNDTYGSRRGTIYAYRKDQGGVNNWGLVKILDNVVPDQSRYNAYSLDMHGDTLVSGANLDTDTDLNIYYPGAFIIYNRNEGGVDNWGQTHRIKPLSPSYYKRMGYMIAISDDEQDVLIGGYTAAGSSGINSGVAQVFNKNHGGSNNWGGVKDITPHGVLSGRNWFGHGGISIDGDLIAVGAYSDSEAGSDTGAAYIFDKNLGGNNKWGLVKKILPPNSDILQCGKTNAVALSNEMLLLGCENTDIINGGAFLYYKDYGGPNNWGLFKAFTDPFPALNDRFGYSVELRDDVLLISEFFGDEPSANAGTVNVYYRNLGGADNWGRLKSLNHSLASSSDLFGFDMTLSRDATRLIVGASNDDTNGGDNGGAYIYYKDHGGVDNWGEVARLDYTDISTATSNLCGRSVAMDGDYAVMGCPYYDLEDGDSGTLNEGKAFLFYKDAGGVDNWGQILSIDPPSVPTTAYDVNDYFAWSVALENNTLFIGDYVGDLFSVNGGAILIYNKDQGGVDNWGEVTRFDTSSSDYLRELSVDDGVIATSHTYEEDPGVTFNDIGGFSIWEAQ